MARSKHIMLAYPYDTGKLERMKRPFVVQPKLDGIRCMTFIHEGEIVLTSSQGNIIESVPHINKSLKALFSVVDSTNDICVLDGELYVHGMNFQEIVSISKRTKNLHEDYLKMEYHIFDCIHNEPLPQSARVSSLTHFLKNTPLKHKRVLKLVPSYICMTKDEIADCLHKCMQQGYEGVIIRDRDAMYKGGRSVKMLKYKPTKSDTYTVIGYNQEVAITGQPKEAIGSFICKCDKSGELFNVGTGPYLTRQAREDWWNKRNELMLHQHRAIVKYQELTKDRKIPRFPVIVDLKHKKQDSYVQNMNKAGEKNDK
tara:strand:- start:5539 stop:6477 length:939 start_codon:yes stop_codon:yes gene_type:complete